jgi:hypothetical protein
MKPEIEFIGEALAVLCPNGAGYNGVDITTVSDPVPTQAELDAQVEIQKAKYATQEYARNRSPLYPAIGDQLDDLYHKGAFSDEMAAKLKKVKDDNPKP